MKHFCILIVVAAAMASCTKDGLTDDSTIPVGEPVEVSLNLSSVQMQTPTDRSGVTKSLDSRASESRVIASDRSAAMLVELIEEPVALSTRAVDDDAIANIWVFQYNGTETTAKLSKKSYYSTKPDKIILAAGTEQRVVIIANTNDTSFDTGMTVGTSTYADLLAKTQSVTDEASLLTGGGINLPMSGIWTGDLETEGATVEMDVIRNVAQVIFKVKTGSNLTATDWTIQMCSVPDVSYSMPHQNETAIFPSTVTSVDYAAQPITTMSSTAFSTFSWYVPQNRRGMVENTTAQTRKTNAPSGATYVKISGMTHGDGWIYTLHLGADFATDYNLRPNYRYTYEVTLYPDPDNTDSRVEVLNLYVGMFGGELLEDESGVWQFTNKLYVDAVDSEGLLWANEPRNNITTHKNNGKGNTWTLNTGDNSTKYPAANYCFQKNVGWESLGSTTAPNYVWYLPAQNQLMGVWIAKNGLDTDINILNHWSSTDFGNEGKSWFVGFGGGTTISNPQNVMGGYLVRCVREVKP
ncbi:DUF4906 domain-containing protein [Bacteroides sp.]|uniref:DUF4906 domain-containing protein n=1 Tax=Bacteroides sp. TaxID=29523 RepID=UPI00262D8650|nr:DUF4906 domain-containing protein [Bacteroides sp.]MDD3038673.1 DUF4906 domain-containing protein [Bacteroides sp.]